MTERMLKFQEQINQCNNNEIACIDETGFCNVGNLAYGYFTKGKIPESKIEPRRKSISLIMAIQPDGIISYKSLAHAFNKIHFKDYLEKSFIPSLNGSIKAVIMDNVAFHKSKEVV